MGEYFKSWRRKIGVVTLVMSCVFAVGLVRSLFIGDRVTLFTGELRGETITSSNGYLEWASWTISKNPYRRLPPRASFVEWNQYSLGKGDVRPDENEGLECRFRCLVFGFGNSGGGSMSLAYAHRVWFLSYWVVVLPLTLLSAYLLLTKPRSLISPKNTESISAGVLSPAQRRAGFVTLAFAAVLMGGWVRSFYFADRFGFSEDFRRLQFCESTNGSLRWSCFDISSPGLNDDQSEEPDNGIEEEPDTGKEADEGMQNEEATPEVELVQPSYHGWQVTSRSQEPSHFISADDPDSGMRMTFGLIGFGRGKIVSIGGAKSVPGSIWVVPYWSLVIPLTLFSLWLLLWMPRKSTPKKIAEPIPQKAV